MEEIQARLSQAVDKMMGEIYDSKLKKFQQKMHLTMADCYAKHDLGNDLQECLHGPQQKMQIPQQVIQNEMKVFQDRLSRCVQACSDDVQDSFGQTEASASTEAKAKQQMMKCCNGCADKLLTTIPNLKSSITKTIDQYAK
jgi:hypothetical protein